MKCGKCGYDAGDTGDTAHVCRSINNLTGEAQSAADDKAGEEAVVRLVVPESRTGLITGTTEAAPNCRQPLTDWTAVPDRLPTEEDGEVMVRMRGGRREYKLKAADNSMNPPDDDDVSAMLRFGEADKALRAAIAKESK